jgi:gamma-glutamyltranspeptidase / glutathione hydrolase
MSRIVFTLPLLILLTNCSGPSVNRNKEILQGKGIIADNGMVVSAHPRSSLIGTKILMQGGNAVDAAIATEFALSVCYPEAGNLGGGGFMLIRMSDGKSEVFDYREKAPFLASKDMYLDKSGNVSAGLSTDTQLASGVPGTVDGLVTAHSKYGRLPFKDVIQPAIDIAEKGFEITRKQAYDLNSARDSFIAKNAGRPAFVKDTLWKEGDLLIQRDLAETLKRIRDNGRNGFYSGRTALLIIKEMTRGNGVISQKDLDDFHTVSRKPLTFKYRDCNIITVPPPSSGGIILGQLLGMISPYHLKDMGFHSSATVHLMAEAERRSFADRSEYMGDPDFMKVSASKLTSTDYLLSRMSTFNESKASSSAEIHPGKPEGYSSEETTHYSVVDSEGNAVSVTTTLNDTFGSGIVVDSAGFLLNNQMDDFSIKPGFPNMYGLVGGEINSVGPGKKILSSMTPSIVEKDGKLFLIVGSPGGSTIPTTVFQVIINAIDFGMGISEAVNAGRFHHQWQPDWISVEKAALDSATLQNLHTKGHILKERSSIGSVNAIMILNDGKKSGGADKRGDNTTCGY